MGGESVILVVEERGGRRREGSLDGGRKRRGRMKAERGYLHGVGERWVSGWKAGQVSTSCSPHPEWSS